MANEVSASSRPGAGHGLGMGSVDWVMYGWARCKELFSYTVWASAPRSTGGARTRPAGRGDGGRARRDLVAEGEVGVRALRADGSLVYDRAYASRR